MSMHVRKITVPDDNDCLFSAISYLTSPDRSYSPAGNMQLREFCAQTVGSDPEVFAEWVLGMPNLQYQSWIRNKFNWGGENEIVILASRKFHLEVCVVSMESFSTLVYGLDDDQRTGRVYLLYTGQHYEPLVGVQEMNSPEGADGEGNELRVWPVGDDPSFEAQCIELARKVAAEKARKAAQRKKLVLRCDGCGALCDDNEAFQVHCSEVEHDDDFMYMCSEVEVVVEAGEPMDPTAIDLTDENVMAIYNHPSQQLANAAPGFPIEVDGVQYLSAHHYWHCAKFMSSDQATEEQNNALAELREKIRGTVDSGEAEQ